MKKSTFYLFFLLFISSLMTTAQNENDYNTLKKYSNFGLNISGVVYRKATFVADYGEYRVKSPILPSFSFGFTYSIPIYRNCSIETGLNVIQEPDLFAEYEYLDGDLPEDFNYYSKNKMVEYIYFIPTIPVMAEYKWKIGVQSIMSFQSGFNLKFRVLSEGQYIESFNNQGTTIPTFTLNSYYKNRYFSSDFVLGLGYCYPFKSFLLKTTFFYNISFNPIRIGEYRFSNLLISQNSGGSFKLSGSYFGLQVSVNFLKSKKVD